MRATSERSRLAVATPARTTYRRWDRRLLWVLGAGVLIRAILFVGFHDLGLFMDEVQYQEIAVNLAEGRGFSLNGQTTSWRPPLYPFALAALYVLTGTTDPTVARAFQALLSLVNCLVVFALARQLFGGTVAVGAAIVFAFYPSLLFYNNHILTEVLFTFLLTVTAWSFARYLRSERPRWLAASGAALALTVLTREVLWPMLGVMALLTVGLDRAGWRRSAQHVAVLVLSFAAVVAPWVARNTAVQGAFTFIATNGGIVFYEGNYAHTPLDRPWRAHALDPELKVRRLLPTGLSEGERQQLAFRKGFEFIRENPGLTLRRAVVKAANVWGLEREVVGTMIKGGYGHAGPLVILGTALVICGAYVVTIVGGLVGLCVALAQDASRRRFHLFVGILLVFVTLAHAPTFGHPRYHLPLMPLLGIYGAYAWARRRQIWERRRSWAVVTACAMAGVLALSWVREIAIVEFERLVGHLGGM